MQTLNTHYSLNSSWDENTDSAITIGAAKLKSNHAAVPTKTNSSEAI